MQNSNIMDISHLPEGTKKEFLRLVLMWAELEAQSLDPDFYLNKQEIALRDLAFDTLFGKDDDS